MSRIAWLALLSCLPAPQSAEDLPSKRDRLSARIETLRGLKFGPTVAVEIGTRREGAGFALEQSKELYGGDLAGFERVFKTLGLVPAAVKLELAIPAYAAASMKAYVARDKLCILDPALPDDELVYRLTLVLSERTAAASGSPAAEPSYDARMARLALRHGEADMTKQLFWAGLGVDGTRTDADHLKKAVESAEKWERETSRLASLVAPRFLIRSSDFLWRRGGIFMESMRQEGGADRLRKVYARPPESTEQILHPEKYLKEERPAALDMKPLEDFFASRKSDPVYRTTLGELGAAILIESLQEKPRPEAAAGWGGDRLMAWAEGGKVLVVWATAWDREEDAREFEDAAAAVAFGMNRRDDAAKAFVVRRGASAALVLNCPEALKPDLVAALWKGTLTRGSSSEPFGKP
ncbi:MAG TPA: hypothetical protein VK661_01280 [Planctomycetota bacterium]|nr:hypothetical protein [Planctomycetota bacterium]